MLDVDGRRVLTDPLLQSHNWPLRRRGGAEPDPRWWRDPDVVLLSHLHSDHAQLSSLRMVDGLPILTAPENAEWLGKRGVSSGVAMGEGWVDATGHGPEVLLVKAVHGDRPMPHRPNAVTGTSCASPPRRCGSPATRTCTTRSPTAEVAGRPVDGAVVPIWGWGSRLSGGHMGPVEAAKACAMVGARWALAVHWGTLHVPWLSACRATGWTRPVTTSAKPSPSTPRAARGST